MFLAIHENLVNKKEEIPGVIYFNKLTDIPKSNTFFISKPYDCDYLQREMFGIVNYFKLEILDWLSFVQDKYVNYDSYFKLVCQLNETDIGKYCRSSNNDIAWTGSVIKDNIELKFIKEQHNNDELLLLTKEKEITQIIRFWFINNKIITYSKIDNYDKEYEKDITDYIKYVNLCIIYYEPAELFTIDIGVYNHQLYIIKYNSLSTSYLYNADIYSLYKALNEFYN